MLAGLEVGRNMLKSWGFRRCEDICWVKSSNKNNEAGATSKTAAFGDTQSVSE